MLFLGFWDLTTEVRKLVKGFLVLPVFSANVYNNTESIYSDLALHLKLIMLSSDYHLGRWEVGGGGGGYTYPATTVCLQKKQQKEEGRGDRKQSR